MKKAKLHKIITASLFAALVCISTMVIQIPSPMSGYVNLGDCFVLLSGWFLGPLYGFLAAGIGSMLADLLLGYAFFAPATFIIKGAVALIAVFLFKLLNNILNKHIKTARIISAAAGELFMTAGYFAYACLILGKGLAAAASIPGDLAQGLAGIISSVILIEILKRTGLEKKLFGNEIRA